jgi:nucleoside-diphosphate-sugar epimerase
VISSITTETDLDDALSRPSDALVAELASIPGDIVILGAGGKMGPTLARMARRALDAGGGGDRRVIAVSRWSDREAAAALEAAGVDIVSAALGPMTDLTTLPDAENVVYMVGAKFGSAERPAVAWGVNTTLPALVGRRYLGSRLAAFSTGNVYPFTAPGTGGPREDDPVGPVGEYAMSCLGRERVLDALSLEYGLRTSLIRLNYAVEPRYGVLSDIAMQLIDGQPVDLTVGYVNVVWQRYANEVALRSLVRADSVPFVINLTGPEIVSVRDTATRLAELLDVEATFLGEEGPTALLSNASHCHALFGYPDLSVDALVQLQAEWILAGGRALGKPTKFQRTDGKF